MSVTISANGKRISGLSTSQRVHSNNSSSPNMLPNTEAKQTINTVDTCSKEVTTCFFSDRQQHSEMDVGRERSTWGEYLHSLTVREYPRFLICPFSHVVSLTTPTLCEV